MLDIGERVKVLCLFLPKYVSETISEIIKNLFVTDRVDHLDYYYKNCSDYRKCQTTDVRIVEWVLLEIPKEN